MITGTVELRTSVVKNSILSRMILRQKKKYGPGRIFVNGGPRRCEIDIDDTQPQRIYKYKITDGYISIPVNMNLWLVFRFNNEVHAHVVNLSFPKSLVDGQWLEKK